MEKTLENFEKKVVARGVQSQEQLDMRIKAQEALDEIRKGKITLNEARVKIGLLPVDDEGFNVASTTAQFHKNIEPD